MMNFTNLLYENPAPQVARIVLNRLWVQLPAWSTSCTIQLGNWATGMA